MTMFKRLMTKQLKEHYEEALEYFPPEQIVGLFCQGSQNYGLSYEGSDLDTKLIVIPSFKDIALNKKPVSATHVRANDEHIDFKDIRLYMETFRKQNLNFLEILFTPYYCLNSDYALEWNRLVDNREAIAHMNPYRAVKSMKGIALEKYHAMEHRYPTKIDIIDKYGYDGKQVHHLLRVDDCLTRYIAGESYANCLLPTENKREHMMEYKRQLIPIEQAREEANKCLAHVIEIADTFCENHSDEEDTSIRELLEDVSYQIMKIAVAKELENK